jgi:quercetin dioxygenase-like cupin family protein
MCKGSELSKHTSTKEAFVFVLEGEGIFTLKSKKIKMKKGVLIHMDKKAVHALSAKKNTSFLLILSE